MKATHGFASKIICGDALSELRKLPGESINCVITSPPYWALRDYGVEGQLGLEKTFNKYIVKLCDIFDEVKRVMKDDGTCWVNIGDTYSSGVKGSGGHSSEKLKTHNTDNFQNFEPIEVKTNLPDKSLCMIPFRFAIEMVNRGWILRNTIIWKKRNCMPSSVKDRFTVDFEYVFFFVKNKKYWFKQQHDPHLTQESRPDGIVRNREFGYNSKLNAMNKKSFSLCQKRGGNKNPNYLNPQGRNRRCIWDIPTQPFKESHSATFPETLVIPMIKAGCPSGGIILDPFAGAGTTCMTAKKLDRNYIGIELNPKYCKMAEKRIEQECGTLL